MNLPEDGETVVTELRPEYGDSTHHIFLGQTLAPEPEGVSDCPVLTRGTWLPLFIGGVDSDPLVLPAGSGMRLPPGTQLVMQLHLQNTADHPITARTAILMVTGDPAADLMPAGIYGLDDRAIRLPARSVDVVSEMGCTVDRPLDVSRSSPTCTGSAPTSRSCGAPRSSTSCPGASTISRSSRSPSGSKRATSHAALHPQQPHRHGGDLRRELGHRDVLGGPLPHALRGPRRLHLHRAAVKANALPDRAQGQVVAANDEATSFAV
jgi:hypothetical protein